MDRSSCTSSSDRLTARREQLLGIAGALAILLSFELLISRAEGLWTRDPRSKTGLHDVLVHEVVPDHRDARIVFLGDSCMRDAFDPIQVENELGLERGQVLNLGVTGGTPFDCELLWREARPQLEGPDVVVVGLEDHHFGPRTPTDIEQHHASLAERLHDFGGETRMQLLAASAWETFAARDLLEKQVQTAVRGTDRSLPIGTDGRVEWRKPEEVRESGPADHDPEPRLTELFGPMRELRESEGSPLSDRALQPIDRLIESILRDERPLRLVVLRLPRRPSFETASRENFSQEFAAVRHALDQLQGAYPRALVIDGARHPDALGSLDETDFYDWGHATGSGSRKLGAQIVKFVRRLTPSLPWMRIPLLGDPSIPRPAPPK